MGTDVTDLEDLTTETAFITEDMLQSISTGRIGAATNGNLNQPSPPDQSARSVFDSSTSLRNVLVARQHLTSNGEHNSNDAAANGNSILDSNMNKNELGTSNRSSIESNNSNNMFYELQNFQSEQQYSPSGNQNDTSHNYFATVHTATVHHQEATAGEMYENLPVENDNQRTIEVEGVTNTSSSDCGLIHCHSGHEESDLAGAAAAEAQDPPMDNTGAAPGADENTNTDRNSNPNPPAELSDILFRFDRQFQVNSGFGFANWRWPHRLSNHSAGGGGRRGATTENNLHKQARWLRRLQVHQSTATPTNSNSNSLRSTSSGSSSSRGGNLQQEWYFYDPRLVPQHRTQRLAVQTDHNRVQTTSYVSNIVNPPTYEELANLPEMPEPSGASGPDGLEITDSPPPFDEADFAVVPSTGGLDLHVPNEPPPPYIAMGLSPVYDLDPRSLLDPPPQYDDHSFSEDDDLAHDPMDPIPITESQCENDNFILTQSTTVPSETDGNFILSAPLRLGNAARRDVSVAPDTTSVASENSDFGAVEDFQISQRSSALSVTSTSDRSIEDIESQEASSSRRSRPLLALEELFREPDISDGHVQPNLDSEIEAAGTVGDEETDSAMEENSSSSVPRSPTRIFPGYQLLRDTPDVLPWAHVNQMTNQMTGDTDDVIPLEEVADDLVDDLPEQHQDNSRSLANFSNDNYPAGFVAGSGPPLRWSRGMGLGRWNAQNWAI